MRLLLILFTFSLTTAALGNYLVSIDNSTVSFPDSINLTAKSSESGTEYEYSNNGLNLSFYKVPNVAESILPQKLSYQSLNKIISLFITSLTKGVLYDDVVRITNNLNMYKLNDLSFSDTQVEVTSDLNYSTYITANITHTISESLGLTSTMSFKLKTFFDGIDMYILEANYYDMSQSIIVDNFLESYNSYLHSDLSKDSDNDGLPDYTEILSFNSDPNIADTDGDGLSDLHTQGILSADDTYGYIKSISEVFNLYEQNEIQDLRPGSKMVEVSGNQATVQLQMEESSDLQTWEDTGTPATMTIPADTDTKFFRFKMVE